MSREVTLLTYAGLSQEELVAMLRSRARKNGAHASVYNGVSLIRQTGKWHAHIDIEGTQVASYFKLAWFQKTCAATPLHLCSCLQAQSSHLSNSQALHSTGTACVHDAVVEFACMFNHNPSEM